MSGMTVGELNAVLDLDDSRYDSKLDQAEARGKRFDGKTYRANADVDISRAQTKLGMLGSSIADNSARLRSAGAGATLALTAPILALDVVATASASSLAEAQNKVRVVFDESADAVLKWSQTSAEAMGQSQRQALAAAGTFGNLFVSMGMGDKMSADMSMRLTQLAGDLASFNDIDPTEALDALRSGLVGETEPMRRLGVNMNEATLKAQALAMGMEWTGETLPPLVKAQAAYALIMDQTATAQGDFARTADEVANSSRTVKAEAEDLAAAWGKELLPVAKDLLGVIKPVLGAFGDLPGPIKQAVIVLGGLAAALGPTLWMLGAVADGIKAVRDAWGWIRTAKTVTDTTAIAANTAAVEANTAARALNAAAPPVGSSGVAPGLVGTGAGGVGAGAAGMGALGTAGAAAVIGSSALLGGALVYYAVTYEESPESPGASTVTGGGTAGVGRAGAASQEYVRQQVQPHIDRYAAGVAELNDVISEMNNLKPSRQTVGATARLGVELDAIARAYPELRDRVQVTRRKLEEGAPAFEAAAKEAASLAEAERTLFKTLEEFNAATVKAAVMGGPLPTAEQASAAAQQQAADTLAAMYANGYAPAVDAKHDRTGQVGMRYSKAAGGADFVTSGPQLLLVGDNPSARERVTVTPAEKDATLGGDGRRVVFDFRGAQFNARSPRELVDLVKRELSREVRYANV